MYKLTLDSESDLFHKLCKPKNPPMPSSTLAAGSGTATFDATFGAPYCQGSSASCDSDTLLEGRFNETNAPNTIDGCKDGPSDPYALSRDRIDYSESVKKIIVESAKEGNSLRGGELASIRATVITNSVKDRVDFYFSNNAASDNPTFTYITTVPTVVGEHEVVLPYKPNPRRFDSNCLHARKKRAVSLQCVSLFVHQGVKGMGSTIDSFHKQLTKAIISLSQDAMPPTPTTVIKVRTRLPSTGKAVRMTIQFTRFKIPDLMTLMVSLFVSTLSLPRMLYF